MSSEMVLAPSSDLDHAPASVIEEYREVAESLRAVEGKLRRRLADLEAEAREIRKLLGKQVEVEFKRKKPCLSMCTDRTQAIYGVVSSSSQWLTIHGVIEQVKKKYPDVKYPSDVYSTLCRFAKSGYIEVNGKGRTALWRGN